MKEYSWQTDAIDSWRFWCRMKALAIGSRRFETLPELYWVEANGATIP